MILDGQNIAEAVAKEAEPESQRLDVLPPCDCVWAAAPPLSELLPC